MDLTLLFTIIAVIVAALIGITQVTRKSIRAILIIVIVFSVGTIAVLSYQNLHVDDWVKALNTEEPASVIKVADEWYTTSTVSTDGTKWEEKTTVQSGNILYFRLSYRCIRDFQNDVVFYETLKNGENTDKISLSFIDNYYVVMDKDGMKKVSGTLDTGYHADAVQGDTISIYYRVKVEGEPGAVVYNAARTVTASGSQYDQCKITVE